MSIFITHLVPRDYNHQINGISQAGQNFCHSFIDAVRPKYIYALLITSESRTHNVKFSASNYSFIQCRFFKHRGFLKLLNIVLENVSIFIKIIRKKQNNIWFYNITTHTWLIYILLKLINKKCYVIFADHNPDLFDSKFIRFLINQSNGIVSFSSNSKSLFLNHKNFHVLAGIINTPLINTSLSYDIKSEFLFSGSLNMHAGIDLCLKTFALLKDSNLIITGQGEGEKQSTEFSRKNSNICYKGNVNYNEYLKILNSCEFVLSLRNPNFNENKYSFPSKIIEFMALGKIVISTIKYSNIPDSLYFYSDYSELCLRNIILKVLQLNESEKLLIRENMLNYVNNEFSVSKWKSLICEVEKYRK
jgi:hypothetical protein